MSFLLLRPLAKCQASASAFNNAGLTTTACGLIDTVIDQDAINKLPKRLAKLANSKYYIVIVTSTVAAEQVVKLKSHWPQQPQFLAVGQSSAHILQQAGIQTIVPEQARTEGLLALPELQNVQNKTLVIMKGYGGRELLLDTLKSRGAKVQEWEVYKRQRLTQPISTQSWQAEQIHCIIATSGEVIDAAFDAFEANWLTSCQWIVVSQRTASIAKNYGVNQIHLSRDASDQALIQCAQQI